MAKRQNGITGNRAIHLFLRMMMAEPGFSFREIMTMANHGLFPKLK